MRPFHESGLDYVVLSDGFKMFSLPGDPITTFEEPMVLITQIAVFLCGKEGQWTEREAHFMAKATNLQSTAELHLNFEDGLTMSQEICARWTFLSLAGGVHVHSIGDIAKLVTARCRHIRQLIMSYEKDNEWAIEAHYYEDEKSGIAISKRHAV